MTTSIHLRNDRNPSKFRQPYQYTISGKKNQVFFEKNFTGMKIAVQQGTQIDNCIKKRYHKDGTPEQKTSGSIGITAVCRNKEQTA